MPGNNKFVCPRLKKPKTVSIGECFGCPFVAATLEEENVVINIECDFPRLVTERIERPTINKIARDGLT